MPIDKKSKIDITAWDWFLVQLDLLFLRSKSDFSSREIARETTYDGGPLVINVRSSSINNAIEQKIEKGQQEKAIQNLAGAVRHSIEHTLEPFPDLAEKFNMDDDLVVRILYDSGKGSVPVCMVKGQELTWSSGA